MIPLTTSASCSTMSAEDVGKIVEWKDDGMAKKTKKPNQKMQAWIEARMRHHLSHAQVHMARELGMNPAKLGKIDNHKQEPWKLPLPQFIEELYFKRFGKTSPEQFCLSRSDAASKQRRRRKGALPGRVPWTARQRVKLHYVDGTVTCKPIGASWDFGPRHATFRGSRPR